MNNNDQKLPRIVLWGGWYGSRNIGDRLLLITITDLIQNVVGPNIQIVLSSRPDLVREYYSPKTGSQLILIKTRPQIFRVIRELIRCDLLIFGGGAPFFDDAKQLLMMSILVGTLKLFRRPYLLWCVTSFKIRNGLSKRIVRWVVEGSANSTCRDEYTEKEFTSLGSKKESEIVADSAFALQDFDTLDADHLFNKYVKQQTETPLFALTPRTLRVKKSDAITHYNPKSPDDVQKEIDCYCIALDWLVEHGYRPIFISMNTNYPDDDRLVAKEVIKKAKYGSHAILIDEMIFPRTAPALYAKCVGSLVSRVHGSVTSVLGNCPVIMYAFENKHKGIMESMSLQDLIFDPASHPVEDIKAMLEYLILHRESIRRKLGIKTQEMQNNAQLPSKYVQEIMKSKYLL